VGKVRWYKRDPNAALTGMAGLTLEERGAYNTILDLIYANDGAVATTTVLLPAGCVLMCAFGAEFGSSFLISKSCTAAANRCAMRAPIGK